MVNYWKLLYPLLLLPAAKSACINCGGADKTSAKRLKMPNKSVFTRLAGIELMEIFEITNQINHEVCAQQCDAHAECAVFEFNLPNKLCVLASEYARLSEDLAKGAFETIVFVKVRGKFTKALPKDKETCLDKSEYEDYVKNEVDKWLNPTPKKSAAGSSSDSPTTTVPHTIQASDPTPAVSTPDTMTTTGNGDGGATTGSSGTTTASGTTTTAGGTTGSESTKITTTTASAASDTSSTTSSLSSETVTSSASPSPSPNIPLKDPAGASPTAAAINSSPAQSEASTTATPGGSLPTLTTDAKGEEEGLASSDASTQSTTDQGSTTTEDPSPTTEITPTEQDPYTSDSTLSSTEPVTSTLSDEEPTTTLPSANDLTSSPPAGPHTWLLKSIKYQSNVHVDNNYKIVHGQDTGDSSHWRIDIDGNKISFESTMKPGQYLHPAPNENGNVTLSKVEYLWKTEKEGNGKWSFSTTGGRWMSVRPDSSVKTVSAAMRQSPEFFELEQL